MRKIPNVNTHIFKQPDLPWGGGAWTPASLSDLVGWWDAQTVVLNGSDVSEETDLSGNDDHFIQTTASLQPPFSGSGATSLISYNGSTEFLRQVVDAANFQNLTYFEYWCYANFDGNNKYKMAFTAEGFSSNNRVAFFILGSSNKIRVISNDDSATADIIETDNAFSGDAIIGYVCTGSAWKIYVNNVLQDISIIGGANTGNFVGGLANKAVIDLATVGAHKSNSTIETPNKEKIGIAVSSATSAADRTNIFNYINERYALGL